jgi:hypothetical protein
MSETTITQLSDPSGFTSDPFTDVLRDGARKLIEQVIHAELAALMNAFSGERLEDGRAPLVRHNHLPEREVMIGAQAKTRSPLRPADYVAVSAQGEIGRRTAALALPQGRVPRRLHRGAAGSQCQGSVTRRLPD